MKTFLVGSSAELMTALKMATGGETILLKAGTYDPVSLRGVNFGDNVTIRSADASNPAVLTGVRMSESSGFSFQNVELAARTAASTYNDFMVSKSSNVHFDQVKIYGPDQDGPLTSAPLMIRDSSNVSVTNSEVTDARYGISMLNSSGITLTGNYFHELRTDGIRGGGNSDVVISDNFFTNFRPEAGDHPDAIQFWTTNTTSSASNITITNNVISRGDGSTFQGIFMRDESGGRYPYDNVVIDGNMVLGGMYNGIAVSHATGLEVTNNTVVGQPGQKSWIRVNDPDLLSGNTAEHYIVDGITMVALVGNAHVPAVTDGGAAWLARWAQANDTGRYHDALDNMLETVSVDAILEAPQLTPQPPVAETPAPKPPAPDIAQDAPMHSVVGTAGNDDLRAGNSGSVLDGGAGNDILRGSKGDDILIGGAGDDTMTGGAGADQFRFHGNRIDGASDTDRITDLNFADGDTLMLADYALDFAAGSGLAVADAGGTAIVSSWAGLASAVDQSDGRMTVSGNSSLNLLVLTIDNGAGQQQIIRITNGFNDYMAAATADIG
jgi:parallel beta-helix repeat protein